jgi:hypothetical protein
MNALVTVLAGTGVLSLIGTLILTWSQRKKVRAEVERVGADASKVITESAAGVVALVHGEMEAMTKELTETRREMGALRRHLAVVEGLLRDRGIPVPDFVWPERRRNGTSHTSS